MRSSLALAASLLAALVATSARGATVDYPQSYIQLLISGPDADERITFTGSSSIQDNIGPGGAATDTNADGYDDAAVQITSLSLTGTSTTLGLGAMSMHLLPTPSAGVLQERVNSLPGILEVQPYSASGSGSVSFNVFFELDFAGGQLKTDGYEWLVPSVSQDRWPPGPGDVLENPNDWVIGLVDPSGDPAQYYIRKAYYSPAPEPATIALLGLAGLLGFALAIRR